MITAEWLKGRIEKREERIRNEGIAEGLAQARRENKIRAEARSKAAPMYLTCLMPIRGKR